MVPAFAIYFFLSSFVFLFVTKVTEPGIIPRKRIFEISGNVPEMFSASPEGAE